MSRALLLCLLTACSSHAAPAPLVAAAPETVAPEPVCLADTLPTLSGKLEGRDCPGDGTACVEACRAGDAHSCWERAAVVVMDPAAVAEAKDLFLRGCELGHGNSCTNYAAGLWVEAKDLAAYECARRIFELSCETRDHFACGMDGRLRLDRRERDDVERGRAVLERSCGELRGFPCRILALNYENGVLGPSDPERIRSLMAEACAGDDPPACGEYETVAGTFYAR